MTPFATDPTPANDGQHAVALAHLSAADARLARVIAHIGPFQPQMIPSPRFALVASIIHQQVSMSAGTAILRRVRALCPRRRLSTPALLALSAQKLRGAGLSRQKVAYVRNIAEFFGTRRVTPAKLRRMSDEEVITAVTQVKGVGRWTAEMLLIFCLARPDVWPVDDLGLRKGVQKLLNLNELPSAKSLHALAEPWRPYRSYATMVSVAKSGGPGAAWNRALNPLHSAWRTGIRTAAQPTGSCPQHEPDPPALTR